MCLESPWEVERSKKPFRSLNRAGRLHQPSPLDLECVFRSSSIRDDDEDMIAVADLPRQNGCMRKAQDEMSNQRPQRKLYLAVMTAVHSGVLLV